MGYETKHKSVLFLFWGFKQNTKQILEQNKTLPSLIWIKGINLIVKEYYYY
jgi:hypothetical protein